jgi:hypothetical protein
MHSDDRRRGPTISPELPVVHVLRVTVSFALPLRILTRLTSDVGRDDPQPFVGLC